MGRETHRLWPRIGWRMDNFTWLGRFSDVLKYVQTQYVWKKSLLSYAISLPLTFNFSCEIRAFQAVKLTENSHHIQLWIRFLNKFYQLAFGFRLIHFLTRWLISEFQSTRSPKCRGSIVLNLRVLSSPLPIAQLAQCCAPENADSQELSQSQSSLVERVQASGNRISCGLVESLEAVSILIKVRWSPVSMHLCSHMIYTISFTLILKIELRRAWISYGSVKQHGVQCKLCNAERVVFTIWSLHVWSRSLCPIASRISIAKIGNHNLETWISPKLQ